MVPMPRNLSAVAWPVRTARLVLRPATPDDVESTWQIRRVPSVSQWLTSAAFDRGEYADTFVEPERLAKTLVVELNGAVIGDLMLAIQDAWAQTEIADPARGVQAELGWVIDPAHAGRGLATEAARALLRICFGDLGLRRSPPSVSLPTSPLGG